MITQAPRGTKDWFGKDMDQRTVILRTCADTNAGNDHES